MALSGHQTRSVFERYNIVSDGDLRDAARKLDAAVLRPSKAEASRGNEKEWASLGCCTALAAGHFLQNVLVRFSVAVACSR
jgi:hypothetical protein